MASRQNGSNSPARRHGSPLSSHRHLAPPANPDAVSTSSSTLVDAGLPLSERVYSARIPINKLRTTSTDILSDSSDSLQLASDDAGDVAERLSPSPRRPSWTSPPRHRVARYDSEVHGSRSSPSPRRPQRASVSGGGREAGGNNDTAASGSDFKPVGYASAARSPTSTVRDYAGSESTQIAWTPRASSERAANRSKLWSEQAERDVGEGSSSGSSDSPPAIARGHIASLARRNASSLSAARSSSSRSNSSATARARLSKSKQADPEEDLLSEGDLAEMEEDARNRSFSEAARNSIHDIFDGLERGSAAKEAQREQRANLRRGSSAENSSALKRPYGSSPSSNAREGGHLSKRQDDFLQDSSPLKRPLDSDFRSSNSTTLSHRREDTLKAAMARAEERERIERERRRSYARDTEGSAGGDGDETERTRPRSNSSDQDRLARLASASNRFSALSSRRERATAAQEEASDDGLDLPPLPSSSDPEQAPAPTLPETTSTEAAPRDFTFPARPTTSSSSSQTSTTASSRHRRTRTGDGAVVSLSHNMPAVGKKASALRKGALVDLLGGGNVQSPARSDESLNNDNDESDDERRAQARQRQVRFSPKPDFRSDSGASSDEQQQQQQQQQKDDVDEDDPSGRTPAAAPASPELLRTPAKIIRARIDLDAALGTTASPATPAPPGAYGPSTWTWPRPKGKESPLRSPSPYNAVRRLGSHASSPSLSMELSTVDESAELLGDGTRGSAGPSRAQSEPPRESTPPLRAADESTAHRSSASMPSHSQLRTLFEGGQSAAALAAPTREEEMERTLRDLFDALRPGKLAVTTVKANTSVARVHDGVGEEEDGGHPPWLTDHPSAAPRAASEAHEDAVRSARLADARARLEAAAAVRVGARRHARTAWWAQALLLCVLAALWVYIDRLAHARAHHLYRTVYHDAFAPEIWDGGAGTAGMGLWRAADWRAAASSQHEAVLALVGFVATGGSASWQPT